MRFLIFFCLVALLALAHVSRAEMQKNQRVSQDEIYRAMVDESEKGYDLTKTTNAVRLLTSVMLQLAKSAHSADPDGPPIYIDQNEFFPAFLDAAGIERESAPEWIRLANQFGQNYLIEYRLPMVIDTTRTAKRPLSALDVRMSWPDSSGLPKDYSYLDTLSTPKMKVRNDRKIRFKLLDYGDMVVIDKMQGLRARPMSGPLRTLLSIIGMGHIKFTRYAISKDDLQIVFVKVKKWPFTKKPLLTVRPDGISTKGLPEDRPDLKMIEDRLKDPPKVTYR